jgi:hypothetical protein
MKLLIIDQTQIANLPNFKLNYYKEKILYQDEFLN